MDKRQLFGYGVENLMEQGIEEEHAKSIVKSMLENGSTEEEIMTMECTPVEPDAIFIPTLYEMIEEEVNTFNNKVLEYEEMEEHLNVIHAKYMQMEIAEKRGILLGMQKMLAPLFIALGVQNGLEEKFEALNVTSQYIDNILEL